MTIPTFPALPPALEQYPLFKTAIAQVAPVVDAFANAVDASMYAALATNRAMNEATARMFGSAASCDLTALNSMHQQHQESQGEVISILQQAQLDQRAMALSILGWHFLEAVERQLEGSEAGVATSVADSLHYTCLEKVRNYDGLKYSHSDYPFTAWLHDSASDLYAATVAALAGRVIRQPPAAIQNQAT